MDTHWFKLISSKVNIREALQDGFDYSVALQGEIHGFTSEPDDQGGHNITWNFKPRTVEILKPTGETLKASKYKQSQKVRLALRDKWLLLKEPLEFEEFYKRETNKIIREINGEEA